MPETTLSFMAILVGTIAAYISKAKVDERLLKHEQKEVEEALSKYNFTIVDGENKKESWSKSYYGMTLERAIELMVQKLSFDESGDLREFICKYKELKEE